MFELFIGRRHRHPRETKPFISIYKGISPRISFSLPCMLWFSQRNTKKVEYLWDAEAKKIAFRPSEGGYRLHIGKTQAYVSARLFLEHIGNPNPGRYDSILDDDNDMIIVQI